VTGVVPIPAALPVPVLPAGESVLSHTPTRGSLADDEAWLDGLRASVNVDLDWKIFDRSHIKIHFAGDVPGARVAVLTVRLHSGPIADTQTIAVEGPAGARPEEMRLSYKGVPSPVLAQMHGSDQGPGYLLVLAPPGASIRTSLGSDYGQDGRLVQRWVTGKVSDGIAIVEVPASKRAPSTHVVVVKDGRTLYDDPAILGWGSADDGGGPAASPADVQHALAASGSSMSWSAAAGLVNQSMGDAILAPSTTTFRIPWTGMLDGQPAALVELAPKDGGRIFYAYHGKVRDQRLLVPSQGAETRPLLWRVWRSSSPAHWAAMPWGWCRTTAR
jgi:hypothetical protein